MVGIDVVSFDTFGPTNSLKPTSLLSNFISSAVTKKVLPRKLTINEFQIDNEELEAISLATLAGLHGRHRCASF